MAARSTATDVYDNSRRENSAAIFLGRASSAPTYQCLERHCPSLRFYDVCDIATSVDLTVSSGGTDISFLEDIFGKFQSRCVFYHPGSFELLFSNGISDNTPFKFLARQLHTSIIFLESFLEFSSLSIDAPSVQRKWTNKLFQLWHIATFFPELALHTRVHNKYGELQERSLVKRVGENRLISTDAIFTNVLVNRITREAFCAGQARLPVIEQELVVTGHEFKAYFADGEAVYVRIARPDPAISDISSMAQLPDISIDKPSPSTVDTIRQFRASLDLRCVSIDFVLRNNEIKILELNPIFDIDWLPQDVSDCIAKNIVKLIEG